MPNAQPLLQARLHLCVAVFWVRHRSRAAPMLAGVLEVGEVEVVVLARTRAKKRRLALPKVGHYVQSCATQGVELGGRLRRRSGEHRHDEQQACCSCVRASSVSEPGTGCEAAM